MTAIFIFSLFYSLDFRHQLLSCYRQDLLQDPDLLRREALRDPLHHQIHVLVADVIVLEVLVRDFEEVLSLVLFGADAPEISFFHQVVDLVCGIW